MRPRKMQQKTHQRNCSYVRAPTDAVIFLGNQESSRNLYYAHSEASRTSCRMVPANRIRYNTSCSKSSSTPAGQRPAVQRSGCRRKPNRESGTTEGIRI
ncbi:AAEL008433-PA [Aedes aegypti]|uniref:AAEL008433-PA n=1 Tax=Aedes aegypti TaxID=7159 RepID=Q16YT0_AEDAE|nr:AAEL008433-PA [Aedes aegypti]